MKITRTVAATRTSCRKAKRPLVLVPTMGALHHGHARLLARARHLAGKQGTVAVSIFVNPTQFGPKEDFSKYPRSWESDLALCTEQGADLIFSPTVTEMYPGEPSISIQENTLSHFLCGQSRPGHFNGVCTVVAKLFSIIQPDIAIFGEKDWQQLAIIRRMVRDLNMPIRIAGFPTVREKDGLAASSRNAYLTPEERAAAPGIFAALKKAAEKSTRSAILNAGKKLLEKIPGTRLDYLELVDAESIQPTANLRQPCRLAAAVFLGKARLIDNIAVRKK